ncbi:hypothetical protein EJB05_37406, partial [Eragrostis curvula]
MASPQPLRRRRPPAKIQTPSHTTIHDLKDDLILEILIRLPSLSSLVRAALSCRAFLAAVRSSPSFRRRFRELHPPPLLGFFFESVGTDVPSFSPIRRRSDPDLAAAVRGADVFLTRLPYHDEASTGWEIADCSGGYLLLFNEATEQIAVYNPLTRALDLISFPPDEICDGHCGKFYYQDYFLLCSDEASGSFCVVCFCHDKSRVRAAIFSSGTKEWQILPWSTPAPGQPSRKKNWLLAGTQATGNLYFAHAKEAYMVVLDALTPNFSFIDLPEHLKGQGCLYKIGETKNGKLCMVSVIGFTLYIWFQRADSDGVEKWVVDDAIPLEHEVLRATETSLDDHGDLQVSSILDGVVFFTTLRFGDHSPPSWFLSFCLETRKLEKLFCRTYDNFYYPYIMAWPPALLVHQEDNICISCIHNMVWLLAGTQATGNLYFAYAKEAYMVVLDALTPNFSFIDLPEHLKGQGGLYKTGETKNGKLCMVSVIGFTLNIWFRRTDSDGLRSGWLIMRLEHEVLRATETSLDDHGDLKVWAILDGVVFFSALRFGNPGPPRWFLSFCLETRKLEKLFYRTYDNFVYPYIMAWPPALV